MHRHVYSLTLLFPLLSHVERGEEDMQESLGQEMGLMWRWDLWEKHDHRI